MRLKGLLALILIVALVCSPTVFFPNSDVTASAAEAKQTDPVYQYFREHSKEFGVPIEILMAVSYAETRWKDHKGEPSQLNGYGLMHLADNPNNQSLNTASSLLGIPVDTLKKDIKSNIRGGAAVLAKIAKEENGGKLPKKLGDWYTTVAKYSGYNNTLTEQIYADEVFKIINNGAEVANEEINLKLAPRKVTPNRGKYENLMQINATPDYPGARWVPAHSSNYTAANRESDYDIRYVIIHTTQGSYAGAISWFQNPSSNVSAHYVIRSSDGQITQMVQNKDIAWHAGNWTYNTQSIGIEHEGYVSNPSWYTDAMYRSSAALTRWLCDRYGIPKTRTYIKAHSEVPGATHTDPGPHWDWNYYMSLVTGGGGTNPNPTEIIVDNDSSRVTRSSNWGSSAYSSDKYGANYYFADPQNVSDAVWYRFNVPSTGSYKVYAWWPANSGYNDKTPYVIKTTSGNVTVHVNQRTNGGKWVLLGTYNLAAGDYNLVAVSRWTNGTGLVIADAIKIVK